MSMPRAAMSVATRTWIRPALKSLSACCRAVWDLFPWMAAAEMPAFIQVSRHLIGPVLGAGEHQSIFDPHLPNEVGEKLGLVALVHKAELLVDDLHRGGHWVHRHPGQGHAEGRSPGP